MQSMLAGGKDSASQTQNKINLIYFIYCKY